MLQPAQSQKTLHKHPGSALSVIIITESKEEKPLLLFHGTFIGESALTSLLLRYLTGLTCVVSVYGPVDQLLGVARGHRDLVHPPTRGLSELVHAQSRPRPGTAGSPSPRSWPAVSLWLQDFQRSRLEHRNRSSPASTPPSRSRPEPRDTAPLFLVLVTGVVDPGLQMDRAWFDVARPGAASAVIGRWLCVA